MKQDVYSLTTLIFSLALVGLAACSKAPEKTAPPPPEVSLFEVRQSDTPMTVELVGETAGYRDVEVRSRVNGILLKRTYVEGQQVKQGQVLFEIDPAPYQATLDQAKGALAQQSAALDKARADRDRVVPLFKENAVSRKDNDDVLAAFASATAAKESAQAKVKEAQLNLDYTKVAAPIGGLTSRGSQSEGSLISSAAATPLTTISQLEPMYVNFSFSEQDRLNYEHSLKSGELAVDPGKKITAHVKLSDGRTFDKTGEVNFADNRVDPKTGTIRGRAIFPNPQGLLLPGQFVRISLQLGQRKNIVMIPERAVMQQQADKLVLTVDANNVVVPRPVKLGLSVDSMVLVEAGLKAGDKIIVDGMIKARPGSPVKPVAPVAPQSASAARPATQAASK